MISVTTHNGCSPQAPPTPEPGKIAEFALGLSEYDAVTLRGSGIDTVLWWDAYNVAFGPVQGAGAGHGPHMHSASHPRAPLVASRAKARRLCGRCLLGMKFQCRQSPPVAVARMSLLEAMATAVYDHVHVRNATAMDSQDAEWQWHGQGRLPLVYICAPGLPRPAAGT